MTDRSKLEALVWKKFPTEGKVAPSSGVKFVRHGGKLRPLGGLSVAELFKVLARVTLPVPMEAA